LLKMLGLIYLTHREMAYRAEKQTWAIRPGNREAKIALEIPKNDLLHRGFS
jgi:hypothetical protein